MIILSVDDNEEIRIDKYLSDKLEISRSKIQKLIKDEKVIVNDKVVSNSYNVKMDDVIPQRPGLISIAGGGSVLSTFLQKEPFYSGRDLYTLDSKEDISDAAKMFIITV